MWKSIGGLYDFLSLLGRVKDQHGPRDVQRCALGEPGFLDLHAPDVARRTHLGEGLGLGRRGDQVHVRADLMRRQRGLPENLPTEGKLDLAHPIREESIVANPFEATG